jgi:hypothetical protein
MCVCVQYRVKPTIIRQRNASNKKYYVQKKAVEAEFNKLLLKEDVGGF